VFAKIYSLAVKNKFWQNKYGFKIWQYQNFRSL